MVNLLSSFVRPRQRWLTSFVSVGAALASWLLSPASALADHVDMTQKAPGHGDTIAYLLVLFCVALAIILLCRTSNRSPDVRPQEADEQ